MGDFDLNVDSLIQRLLENFKKQKEAEEHAQKLLIAQQLAAAGGAAAAVAAASVAVNASSPTASSSGSGFNPSFGSGSGSGSISISGSGSNDPLDDLTEQQRRLLQQYSISPPSETMISADGDQITVHHPREEPKKSRLKLRDFFVAEFGIKI
nr:uncharacterized protein LOC122321064 [Drosophila bipectinata]